MFHSPVRFFMTGGRRLSDAAENDVFTRASWGNPPIFALHKIEDNIIIRDFSPYDKIIQKKKFSK